MADITNKDLQAYQNAAFAEVLQLGGADADWTLETAADAIMQVVSVPGGTALRTLTIANGGITFTDRVARIVTLSASYAAMLAMAPGNFYYDILISDGGTVRRRAQGRFNIAPRRSVF